MQILELKTTKRMTHAGNFNRALFRQEYLCKHWKPQHSTLQTGILLQTLRSQARASFERTTRE